MPAIEIGAFTGTIPSKHAYTVFVCMESSVLEPFVGSETEPLISSENIGGIEIFCADGESIGMVEALVIKKRSGQVDYVVMSLQPRSNKNGRFYLLPWDILSYDAHADRYIINFSMEELVEAPSFSKGETPWLRAEFGRQVYEYYGLDYWFSH